MQVFDLSKPQILRQVALIGIIVKDLNEMLAAIPSEDFPSNPQAIEDFRRRYIAQVMTIVDTASSLASKSILPSHISDNTEG